MNFNFTRRTHFAYQSPNRRANGVVGGQVGNNLASGGILNDGLLGHLADNLQNSGNDFLCRLGPNLLQAIVTNNRCPRNCLKRNALQSKEQFCAFFNTTSQLIRDCLSEAAFRAAIDLHGIVKYDTNFGRCCTK